MILASLIIKQLYPNFTLYSLRFMKLLVRIKKEDQLGVLIIIVPILSNP